MFASAEFPEQARARRCLPWAARSPSLTVDTPTRTFSLIGCAGLHKGLNEIELLNYMWHNLQVAQLVKNDINFMEYGW
jgi:hypothetical protein